MASVVICIRDPDYENEFVTFGDVRVLDIDLGRSSLNDDDEWYEFRESHMEEANKLITEGVKKDDRLMILAGREYKNIIERLEGERGL